MAYKIIGVCDKNQIKEDLGLGPEIVEPEEIPTHGQEREDEPAEPERGNSNKDE